MINRKNVMKGLAYCIDINGGLGDHDCEDCPYFDDEDTCESLVPLLTDARDLLEEQESRWSELRQAVSDMRDNGGRANQHDACAYIVHLMDLMTGKVKTK